MAKEIPVDGYQSGSIPEDWEELLFEDLETANGYKKYFTVESHDDPFCSQEEFEFWVMEKEAVMPNGFFHDEEQEVEDISLEDWLKREGIMEVPEDLDHGNVEDRVE